MLRLILALAAVALVHAQSTVYSNRWVYVSHSLVSDSDVEYIRQIAVTAAQHGYTAIVLAAGLDRLDRQPAAYFTRLAQVKQICDDQHLEIIPAIFNPGYGSDVYAHDRNLAEGFPVTDALYVVSGTQAHLAPDPPVAFVNGSLENYKGNTVTGWNFNDGPGTISFIDTDVVQDGQASLRFENFTSSPAGNGRLMQEVPVHPYRNYRVSFWVKSDALQPADAFMCEVLTTTWNVIAPLTVNLPSTTGWRQITWGFNSGGNDKVRIYAGIWGGESGRFWLDNFRMDEVGLLNVLRRDGTPLIVRDDASDTVYQEGVDYAAIRDPLINFIFDHDGPPITLLPASAIQDGQRLRVSYYHGMAILDSQVSTCMSDPRLYDFWRAQVEQLNTLLAPSKYFMNFDEIREGGTDLACRQRGMTMAQILGDSITQAVNLIRAVNPAAEVYSWSDMLDPTHNAHGNYYLVNGDFTGSWNYVPPDLGIVDWNYGKRRASLDFFSGLGFRTIAGAYYDASTLDSSKNWLAALDQTPGAVGIMYTTWLDRYGLLAAFGDLVSLPH